MRDRFDLIDPTSTLVTSSALPRGPRSRPRVRSNRCVGPLRIRFPPGLRRDSAALFLRRRCDRTRSRKSDLEEEVERAQQEQRPGEQQADEKRLVLWLEPRPVDTPEDEGTPCDAYRAVRSLFAHSRGHTARGLEICASNRRERMRHAGAARRLRHRARRRSQRRPRRPDRLG